MVGPVAAAAAAALADQAAREVFSHSAVMGVPRQAYRERAAAAGWLLAAMAVRAAMAAPAARPLAARLLAVKAATELASMQDVQLTTRE